MATDAVAPCPATIDAVAGATPSVTAGLIAAVVTVSETGVVASATPVPRARTVTLVVVTAVVPEASSARLLVTTPAPSVDGVNVAVTPDGTPSAVSCMSPAKLMRATAIAAVPVAPCTTETAAGVADAKMPAVVTMGFVVARSLHAAPQSRTEARVSREIVLCMLVSGRCRSSWRWRNGPHHRPGETVRSSVGSSIVFGHVR